MGAKKESLKRLDFTLILVVLLISIYGIIVIYSATQTFPPEKMIKMVKMQIFSTILGFICMFTIVFIGYEFIGNFYIPIYLVSVGLLLATQLWGIGAEQWGADSWLKIGPVVFQTAELAKVGLIIFVAKFLENHQHDINEIKTLATLGFFVMIPIAFIAKQPDFGTSVVVLFIVAVMVFVAGLDWKYIKYACIALVISLPLIWLSLDEYQIKRLVNFRYPEDDPTDSGYNALMSRIAVGSGQIFGQGLLKGGQTQNGYLPEKQTDFIFSALVEELGLIGGILLISLYHVMLMRILKIAKKSDDKFGSLMVTGFFAMFLIHIWENIAMNIGLMPITGIPLPFMSYGGTFQLINLICIGITLSVGIHRSGLNFK